MSGLYINGIIKKDFKLNGVLFMSMDRNDISKIGANIAKYRKMKKYTQKQLGDLLDINSKTISKWENGNIGPDITVLNSLANVLSVTVEELLSGVSTTNRKKRFFIFVNFCLTILLIIFISISCYLYFNRWEVYDFKSNHELFKIDGYVVSNGKENRYVITKSAFDNVSREEVMVDSLTVELYSGEELINNYVYEFDKSISIEEAVTFIDNDFGGSNIFKFDFENYYLVINCENSKTDESVTYTVDFEF